MTYTSKQQLTDAIGEKLLRELADKSIIGVPDEDTLRLAIDKANSEVDSYIGAVVTIPMGSPAPGIVKAQADILALYHLYFPRVPEQIATARTEALETLANIRDGKQTLGNDPNGDPYIQNSTVTVESAPQVLTQERMEHFLDNPNSYTHYHRYYTHYHRYR